MSIRFYSLLFTSIGMEMFVILYENASTSCVLAANFISRMLLIIVMNLLADCLVVWRKVF